MEKKFLTLHFLVSHNPSCLNRDDMNMQKTAIFGGARRIRVSSQCMKRAVRRSEGYQKSFGETSLRTSHTALLLEHLKEAPVMAGVPEEILAFVLSIGMNDGTLTAWSVEEARFIADIVSQVLKKAGESPVVLKQIAEHMKKEETSKGKGSENTPNAKANEDTAQEEAPPAQKDNKSSSLPGNLAKLEQELKKAYKNGEKEFLKTAGSPLDVALSGRMCASGLLENVEAAMSISHLITTHEATTEIDWFTGMGDLKGEVDGKAQSGADHLNTQEFGSGVFYGFAQIDLELLSKNLGGKSEAEVLEMAAEYARLLATVTPTGKQKPMASPNFASFFMAVRTGMPLSMANAFENPVRAENGFVAPSIRAIEEFWSKARKWYGLMDDRAAVFSVMGTGEAKEENIKYFDSLPELVGWIRKG